MNRFYTASLPAAALPHALSPLRRMRSPSKLPTLAAPTLWTRLLALIEPAPARQRRERRQAAVVLPLRRATQ